MPPLSAPAPPALVRPTTSASRRSCNRRGPGLPQPAKPSTARAADPQPPQRPVLSRQPPAANHLPPDSKQCTLSGYAPLPIPRNVHRLARPHSRSTPPAPPSLPAPGEPVDPCTLGQSDPAQSRRPACPEPVEGREPSGNHEIRRSLPPPAPRPQPLEPHARPHPDLPGVPNPQSARTTCRPVTPTAHTHNPRRHPKNRQSSHPPGRNPPQGFRPGGCAFPHKPAASAHPERTHPQTPGDPSSTLALDGEGFGQGGNHAQHQRPTSSNPSHRRLQCSSLPWRSGLELAPDSIPG